MENKYINIHQDLLDRCIDGDKKAQFEIYRLYYKSMYNSSLRIVDVPEEAEDIMQESFLMAFHKLKTYSGDVSFGAWLKKIVINRSLDVLRKRKVLFEELHAELPIVNEPEPETASITVEEIKAAINSLSDGYRTILSLILLEGYDHEEVSEILGIKNVTSRTQFSRARQRLREILTDNRRKADKGEKLWMN
ncbi:MAG TPA: RNA polymerase sigma factor [Prolixibacteraceae bacterium]|nr:RNA polymerase sigma factor [Prolixibacteraceae bacterium]